MKHFLKEIVLPALIFVLAVVGAATICIAVPRSCSAQTTTSRDIRDMTQSDVDTLFEDNEKLNHQLNAAIHQLDAYRDYYFAVEHLLDIAGVGVDSPILESDAGATYLDRKWLVDSLEKENEFLQPMDKQAIGYCLLVLVVYNFYTVRENSVVLIRFVVYRNNIQYVINLAPIKDWRVLNKFFINFLY